MRNKYLSFEEGREVLTFNSAEEAWFWYCLCEQMERHKGKKSASSVVRPCEASDIVIAVKRLAQTGQLKAKHIKVLSKYGFCQVPPHPHFGDSLKICELWTEALSFLGDILKKKGIVTA